jgi:hypothetical protein
MGTICNAWCRGTTDWSEWSRPLSRLLVLLTTLLLLVMPLTEHLCNWDKFLRGGPDVEFSLLAWLLFAAMVVLSMNGSMLRPAVMQPGMMQPIAAASPASRGSMGGMPGCGVMAQWPASSGWANEPVSASSHAARDSRTPLLI